MTKNVDWYDYENQKVISTPKGECEVHIKGVWFKTFVVGVSLSGGIVFKVDASNKKYGYPCSSQIGIFRPLDWNKNQKKPVDLSWLVSSGIDCEFEQNGVWVVACLCKIGKDADGFDYHATDQLSYVNCRPRMNHPIVLTQEQIDLIPQEFSVINHAPCTITGVNSCVVEFAGLPYGYCWPWEVDCEQMVNKSKKLQVLVGYAYNAKRFSYAVVVLFSWIIWRASKSGG